jgi:hypothetical protein
MNANQSLAIPTMRTKGLHRLPYLAEPLLRFDLSCKSFDEKCEDRAHGSPAQKDEEHAADD